MKNISYILLFLLSASSFAQTEVATTPQIVFKIPLGEKATTNGVTIHFKEVLEDSRCPENVQCVWAGQARVQVAISGGGVATTTDLIVGKKDKDAIGEVAGFVYRAVQLAPYPVSPENEKRAYVLLILKEKSN